MVEVRVGNRVEFRVGNRVKVRVGNSVEVDSIHILYTMIHSNPCLQKLPHTQASLLIYKGLHSREMSFKKAIIVKNIYN